ncbi:MAG: HAD family phosphatase [Acetatifactor sp.]|nr:HAD family phosphatase [Acetatifactor sp.]
MDNKIKAVIFDMDGTLVDTEKWFRIFWPEALKKAGYEMSDEQALFVRSLGKPYSVANFKEWYGEDFDYEAVRNIRRGIMKDYFADHEYELKKGAIEIMEILKEKNICIALATATPLDRAGDTLKRVGLYDYFDEIISATMVEKGKPAPDIYLYACDKLGLKPEECLVVEDSPNGVISGYLAGCKTVMVPDQTPVTEELRPMLYGEAQDLSKLAVFLA